MIFARSGLPVRLFYDIPDFTTDKGVQAEIYRTGTSSGGETLDSTVTLTHLSNGRYSALYTPPADEQSYLSVRYIVYTDSTCTTRSTRYDPASEQMVLNMGVGSGGGGTRWSMTDKEMERLIDEIWKKKPKEKEIKVEPIKVTPDLDKILPEIKKIKTSIDAITIPEVKDTSKEIISNIYDSNKSLEDQLTTSIKLVSSEIVNSINKNTDETKIFLQGVFKENIDEVSSSLQTLLERIQDTSTLEGNVEKIIKEIQNNFYSLNNDLSILNTIQSNSADERLRIIEEKFSENKKLIENMQTQNSKVKQELVKTVQDNVFTLGKFIKQINGNI